MAPFKIPEDPDALRFLLRMPALTPPPGADRTMTTSGPGQVWYLVVAITCIAIPGIFLLMRIYTKVSIIRTIEPADYFIGLAFPLIVVEIVLGWYMIKWGAGVHQWQVTYDQLFNQLYWMNTAEVIYCPLCFLVKMAILLQYLRLFAPTRHLNRLMWYGSWISIVVCFCFYTVFMFWTMFYCTPRRMIWYKFTPNGKCADHSPIVMTQGGFNMGSDLVILFLPTASLWKLHVPQGRKIMITLLFATGLLACVASTMRIVYTIKIANIFRLADVSYYGLFIGLWTEAEAALGFIVACSLSLPKLIQAKRSQFSRAISLVSSPFSSSRGARSPATKSLSLGSTLKSKGTQVTVDDVGRVPASESQHALYGDERYHTGADGRRTNIPLQRVIPSASSQYSGSANSNRMSIETAPPRHERLEVDALKISKSGHDDGEAVQYSQKSIEAEHKSDLGQLDFGSSVNIAHGHSKS